MNKIKEHAKKINSMPNSLTSNGRYKNFVQDLETKWRNSYKTQNNNLNDLTQYHLSKNAIFEVNDALNNPNTNNDSMVKLRDYTPRQLVDVGVDNLPMLVRKGHLRENILTEEEAKSKGYSIKGKHYHGLGIDAYIKAIDSLDDPIVVYRYTNKGRYSKDNFIVLTEVQDSLGNNIIVPIEINKKGQYNSVEIDTNKIKTVYGRETKNYFDNKVAGGELIEVYNKKRSIKPSVQFGSLNTSTDNNITQSKENVKLPTK